MEDLKALAMRGYESFNAHDLSQIEDLMHPDFVEHESLPVEGHDWNAVKQSFEMFFSAMPNMRFDIDHISVDGDLVWAHGHVSGTQDGPFMGMDPTGKKVDISFIDLLRFENGKVCEHWGVTDNLLMMQQLGMVPETPPA